MPLAVVPSLTVSCRMFAADTSGRGPAVVRRRGGDVRGSWREHQGEAERYRGGGRVPWVRTVRPARAGSYRAYLRCAGRHPRTQEYHLRGVLGRHAHPLRR